VHGADNEAIAVVDGWMNIGDRSMPFLALVEHTNHRPGEWRQSHPLHLELPASGARVFQHERGSLWAI
jgi:hypothetical protein